MTADGTDQAATRADASTEAFGHFLDPFAPIPTEKAARGRVRLAAIVAYLAWIAAIVTFAMIMGQTAQGEEGEPALAGARSLVPIIGALLIVMPVAATISLFVQNILSTSLLGLSVLIWLLVRIYMHVNMVAPSGIGIVLAAASVMFTVLVAIALTHAVRGQLSLR